MKFSKKLTTIKPFYKKTAVALIIIFGLLIVTGYFVINKNMLYQKELVSSTEKSKLDNIYYNIEPDTIIFRYKFIPESDEKTNPFHTISVVSKDKFPDLFEEIKPSFRIIPLQVKDKLFYLIGNVYPDHGAYSYRNFVILDIFNKNKILYSSKKLFNNGIFSNVWLMSNGDILIISGLHKRIDFGLSPSFEFREYIGYNNITNQYISKNIAYKKDIEKIVNEMDKYNGCSVKDGGPKVLFEEIKNKFGEDYVCHSSDEAFNSPEPGFAGKPYNGMPVFNPMTPREYFLIKNTYLDVLKGIEKSIFH